MSGSVARRCARDGYDVGLLGNEDNLVRLLAEELKAKGVTVGWSVADVTDVSAARAALAGLATDLGRVDVLHLNPSAFRQKAPLELGVDELLADVALGVGALLAAVQAARPLMSAGARVTVT